MTYTVCGKRIVIIRQISFMRPAPGEPPIFYRPKSTIPLAALRDPAFLETKGTRDTITSTGRVFRKAKVFTALVVDRLDLLPHFTEMGSDTISTKPNCPRNSPGFFTTMLAGSHFGTPIPYNGLAF